MSNINPYGGGGSKNGPWSRAPTTANSNIQQQLLNQSTTSNMNNINSIQNMSSINNMSQMSSISSLNSNIVPFQQQQVFQNMGIQHQHQQQNLGLGLQQMPNTAVGLAGAQQLNNQLYQQVGTVGAVTYPNPRALNPAAFSAQTQPPKACNTQSVNAGNQSNATQKVFTGTVTTVHDNFGFVDEDVFFQTSSCVKGSNPMVGDRVLVEAMYNPRMPFKWNATRIQVLPMGGSGGGNPNPNQNQGNRPNKGYNSLSNNYNAVPPPSDSNGSFNRRPKASAGGRGRERSRDRDRDDEEIERKKRREERMREREKEEKKSPLRGSNRSRSPKTRNRRSRIVPRYVVQIPKIALDMLNADVLEVRRRYGNLYIPSDFFNSSFRWLDAFPADKPFTLNKSCSFHIMSKDVESVTEDDAVLEPPDSDYLFSAKVMLMSVPGMDEIYQKCCAMAEEKDRRDRDSEDKDYVHPTRLINFLVGLRGKNETMAIGGPWSPSLDGANPEKDPSVLIKTAIRSCKALTGIDLSNCTKWYRFVELYYRRDADGRSHKGGTGGGSSGGGRQGARVETVVLFLPDVWSCLPTRLEWDALQTGYRRQLERKLKAGQEQDVDEPQQGDEKEEEPSEKVEQPTHYSQLDPKTMSVADMRKELKARTLNSSGLKSQLIAKLSKALKSEASKSEDKDSKDDSEKDDADDSKSNNEEKKIDEKERQLLEKKYSLPESQSIIVHPSKTAKSGKFECTVMSLSLLLDYRPEDTKEHSFEVSLFAELFNEMLMRDFGFSIYRALYELPDKPKETDKDRKREKDKDEKDKKDKEHKKDREKKDSLKSDHDSDASDFEDDDDKSRKTDKTYDKSDKDKKKRERPKMYTKERHLLLSFVYFDQTHCGYIFEKDIEDLLYTLGLNLSRAQVRKLVGKVITRDSLHYRKLTDKVKEEDFIVIDDSEKDSNLEELAVGNKKLLNVFKTGNTTESEEGKSERPGQVSEGFIMFQGALVDVSKLLAQLDRSEKARLDTEARMMEMKAENSKLSDKYQRSTGTVKNLSVDLKEYKEKLRVTEDSLHRITACSKLFQTTLMDIHNKIEPVLLSATPKEDKRDKSRDRDRKDEAKVASRWEKDSQHANSNNTSNSIKSDSKTPKENKNKENPPVVDIKKEETESRSKKNDEEKQKKNDVEPTEQKVDKTEEVSMAEPKVERKEEYDDIEFKPEVIDEIGDVEMENEIDANDLYEIKSE